MQVTDMARIDYAIEANLAGHRAQAAAALEREVIQLLSATAARELGDLPLSLANSELIWFSVARSFAGELLAWRRLAEWRR